MVRKVRRSVTQYLLKLDQENLIRWERKQGTPYLQLYAAKTGNGTLDRVWPTYQMYAATACQNHRYVCSHHTGCKFHAWGRALTMQAEISTFTFHRRQKTLRKSYTSGMWGDEVWSSNYTTDARWRQALWNISTLQHMHAELLNKIKEHVVTGQSCVFQETGLCLVRKYL